MGLGRKQLVSATVALTAVPFVAAMGVTSAGAAEGASCTPDVGGTGLSAAVVAHAHQKIVGRTVDATGCDVGIYIGAGAQHVLVESSTVSGANFQGIFAEKTSHLRIAGSTVTGNAFNTIDPSAPPLPGSGVRSYVGQAFAISLFGVSHATVVHNTVYNNGRGGIGLMDNGPFDPGARMQDQDPTAPLVGSWHVRIAHNRAWANYNGCAVVAATQNVGGRLGHLLIRDTRITGTGFGAAGPDIGGIVVAADLPASRVAHVRVDRNRIRDSFEAGVLVNAEAPTSHTVAVTVADNRLVGNNVGDLRSPDTTGIITWAVDGAANRRTVIRHNVITRQYYGIWSRGEVRPRIAGNVIRVTPGGVPISFG